MPFLLDGNPTTSEISDAVNYLLSNFDTSYSADSVTGQISGPTGTIVGYLYKYMAVKYADSSNGTVNFSNVPTNRQYFGIRNSNDAAESSNPVDYVWSKVTGGFGTSKYLWYITTGGRQIQFVVSTSAPDAGWLQVDAGSIDLDVITSSTTPIVLESFAAYFTPAVMLVPRSGSPLAPVFTSVSPIMYATDKGTVVPYSGATTDTGVTFTNNTWRIGNSSTTGFGDISYNGITIGNPTDGGDYAIWPNPTAMSISPAYITVPARYKNNLGVVTQAAVAVCQLVFSDPGATGATGPTLDISGYTSFTQAINGSYSPATASLSAVITNITSPTYAWTISGATPTSASTSTVVITPNPSTSLVVVTLTVNGSNLASPLSKTIQLPVVYNGAAGSAGANGQMSAFPTIYQWTNSSTPPARPLTTSTYTWSSGAYTAPSGWSTTAPSDTTPGDYLWSITIPLVVSATTTTSTLDWTSATYPIRAIGYNGANGTNGAAGSAGSATFLVTRSANDSSPPTNAEVTTAIGRNPVAGDIVTVSYNSANNSVVYRYVTSWVLQTTYITGDLIVQNTITANKLSVTSLGSITANTGTLIVTESIQAGTAYQTGTSMGNSGAIIYSDGRFAVGDQNKNIAYNGSVLTLNGDIVASSNLQALSITAGKIAASTITADKLNVTNLNSINAVTGTLLVRDPGGGSTGASYIQAGTAYQTGTTMGGAGGILYSDGRFAFGDSSSNINYNLSQLTLNGNIVSINNLQQGTNTTQSGNTFGYGNGTTLYGISTCGFFKSTRYDSAALAASGINNIALAAIGASYATGLFSNTLGVDSIDPYYVILGATIGGNNGGYQQAAFFQRRGSYGYSASDSNPDSYTSGYARIAYLQTGTGDTYGGKFMTTSGTTDVRGITIGGPTNGLSVLGAGVSSVGFSPFTGMHLCLLSKTITPVPGDIYYDTSIYLKPNVNDVLSFIALSNAPNMKGTIGVFTNMSGGSVPPYMQLTVDKPYIEHGVEQHEVVTITDPKYKTLLEQNTLVLVNALGEGLINVCGENGDLEVGDLIVTSSIAGKGMKQNDDIVRSITVARSREAVTFTSPTEVKQVACIYLCG